MANSYFTIPDTGTIVYNGDVVKLSEYTSLAIAAYGWYKHNQASELGWHFVLLDTKVAIPAGNVNLSLLTLVTRECGGGCHPHPHPCPPEPTKIKDRAFITLDNIAQRDRLDTTFMPDGRIIRVNDAGDGSVEYFQWSVTSQEWQPWDIANNSYRILYKDSVSSLDSEEFTDDAITYVFTVMNPLAEALGISEGTLCELKYRENYQIVTAAVTQDTYIRRVYQVSPEWLSGEWFSARDQQRLAEIEAAVETWKQNDILENRLAGAPNLTEEELNALLEARLNGETRSS